MHDHKMKVMAHTFKNLIRISRASDFYNNFNQRDMGSHFWQTCLQCVNTGNDVSAMRHHENALLYCV